MRPGKPSWSTPEQESFPTKRYKKTGGLPHEEKFPQNIDFVVFSLRATASPVNICFCLMLVCCKLHSICKLCIKICISVIRKQIKQLQNVHADLLPECIVLVFRAPLFLFFLQIICHFVVKASYFPSSGVSSQRRTLTFVLFSFGHSFT